MKITPFSFFIFLFGFGFCVEKGDKLKKKKKRTKNSDNRTRVSADKVAKQTSHDRNKQQALLKSRLTPRRSSAAVAS